MPEVVAASTQPQFNSVREPSNLYVLSQQQSTQLRLGQAESGVASLILCGDWTPTRRHTQRPSLLATRAALALCRRPPLGSRLDL